MSHFAQACSFVRFWRASWTPQKAQVRRLGCVGMTDQRKQKTRPKKGKPIEIPVPKREDFEKLLSRAAKARAKGGR